MHPIPTRPVCAVPPLSPRPAAWGESASAGAAGGGPMRSRPSKLPATSSKRRMRRCHLAFLPVLESSEVRAEAPGA